MKWRLSRVALAMVAAALLFAVVAPCGAEAAMAPEWKIATLTNPTHLVPESPRAERQEVTIDATGGTFTLSWPRPGQPVETTATLPYDASAAQVESALNKLSNLYTTVTGGPGGTSPYVVTFVGFDGNQPEGVLSVNGAGLSGGGASGSVKELSRGEFEDEIQFVATNVGGAVTNGSAITVSATLPGSLGLTVNSVTGTDVYALGGLDLPVFGAALTCAAAPAISCNTSNAVMPGDQLVLSVHVSVPAGEAEGPVDVAVGGGGAASASVEDPLTASGTPSGFGMEPGSVSASVSTTAAGGHPDVTTTFAMNLSEASLPARPLKDVRFDIPPGLVGQAAGMPRCTVANVNDTETSAKACPSDTIVGMETTYFTAAVAGSLEASKPAYGRAVVPIYNIAPSPGEPVAFEFIVSGAPVRLDTSLLSNGQYGVRVTAPGLTKAAGILLSWTTIWGVPWEYNGAGPYNTSQTLFQGGWSFGGTGAAEGESSLPLLTNPQQCGAPLHATMEADSWQQPGVFVTSSSLPMGTLTGCDLLRFEPGFSMLPDTLEAGKPAGYTFNLRVPQRNELGTLATPTVKKVQLTLPAGTVVNPSAAWGLKACSNAQFYGPNHPSEEPALSAECPREAQVGKMQIKTPALEELLEGEVYLAEPECSPCTPEDAADGKMVRLFVNIVGSGESGLVVKLEGHGMINQQTGQITTVFDENPQLPFESLRLILTGGERAVLANPRTCGTVESTLNIDSWDEALPETVLASGFEVNQNCFAAQFDPSLRAGMPNIQAGEHGEFTLAFGRSDSDEMLKQITLHMPPGLLGTLAGVELCKEAQANAGTCGANSLIGSVQALTGPGANPFLVEGGKVYLTEGYGGAPYGLSIVVPAVAGPYTLSGTTGQGTVVVRSQIFVDQHTAQLTVVSGELPSVLDGIPLQLRAVSVKIDRPGFTFNPTNCEKLQITGTLTSVEGMSANVDSPFQVTNCASLAFKPSFTAVTSTKISNVDGVTLHVSLSYPTTANEANLRLVKVELPKQLPSRLSTLQKACTAAQFEANPAGCPSASVVGHVKAISPIVPVPLEGPAYFVSHGGEAFPSLVLVLQGYGVTVDLVGTTFIDNTTGVTSSTFKTVPDVPVESFELDLPAGPYSALTANANLCSAPLAMPTEMIAQSGATITQSTKIAVQGCKPTLTVLGHTAHAGSVTIRVKVPAAGTLVASGTTFKRTVARPAKSGTVTLRVALTRHGHALLSRARRRGRRLQGTISLTFTPRKGSRLKGHVTVLMH